MSGQLPRAFFVGAVRESDEEMLSRLADIAAVDCAGALNGERGRKESGDRRANRVHFTFAAVGAGTGKNGASLSENGGVFDEGRVGEAKIGVEDRYIKAALLECIAMCAC